MSRPALIAFEHITVSTGAARMSPRSEVRPEIIAEVGRRLHAGEDLWVGWAVTVAPVTEPQGVEGEAPAAWIFDAILSGRRVSRSWLCWAPGASDALWEAAAEDAFDPHVVLHRPRGVPWLASSIDPTCLGEHGFMTTDVMKDVCMIERLVAWALLDGKP